jgi:hypothetical protein
LASAGVDRGLGAGEIVAGRNSRGQ